MDEPSRGFSEPSSAVQLATLTSPFCASAGGGAVAIAVSAVRVISTTMGICDRFTLPRPLRSCRSGWRNGGPTPRRSAGPPPSRPPTPNAASLTCRPYKSSSGQHLWVACGPRGPQKAEPLRRAREDRPGDNAYAHPIENLVTLLDRDTGESVELQDGGSESSMIHAPSPTFDRQTLGGGAASGPVVRLGQGPSADFAGLVGGDAEQAQQVLGDLVGGLGIVAVGLVVQQLTKG